MFTTKRRLFDDFDTFGELAVSQNGQRPRSDSPFRSCGCQSIHAKRTFRDTTYFLGVVAKRIGNFFAGLIRYFLVSVMRRSKSWRDRLVLRFLTRRRSLPYTSSEKRSALATLWVSMSVPARILITENAGLGTTWHRAGASVSHGEGFWKSVYERSQNGKECFGGSQS